ncbi:MAG: glutamyl-tRNA reductase [Methylococcaceae bacterium]|nr:glutamyl-tRNA reductase [Methylococcaceae bacterium]MCI0667261.1 glutamyl-tRNA reductase [Methylococcaceae bacterium]MCI0733198.1 glutamyl-tRNA reductase [Methylococcaceae bacterium]
MTLLALGINHNTAPLSIREKLSFSEDMLRPALHELRNLSEVREAAILSTCNRTELYCGIHSQEINGIVDWIAQSRNLSLEEFKPYLYTHLESRFIRHIFRVACGLDSLILGEPQILGQMKSAYQAAVDAGTLGKQLGQLFRSSFSTAKKVRTDTAIGSSPVSVAFAAVRLAQQIFDKLSEQTALLVGAGETIELTARHLHQQSIGRLIIANRTLNKAHELAGRFNGFAIVLSDIPEHLAEADIVVSSTASPLPILGKGRVESAIKQRKHKPMLMIDLAVPRDIEPEVEQLRDVYLYTVDDLKNTIEENIKSRLEAAEKAEEIIDRQVEQFLAWLRGEDAVTTIQTLRAQAEMTRDETLNMALAALRSGKNPEQVMNTLARRLTNKLMHDPTTQLRQAGRDERRDILDAARELFNLKSNDNK